MPLLGHNKALHKYASFYLLFTKIKNVYWAFFHYFIPPKLSKEGKLLLILSFPRIPFVRINIFKST